MAHETFGKERRPFSFKSLTRNRLLMAHSYIFLMTFLALVDDVQPYPRHRIYTLYQNNYVNRSLRIKEHVASEFTLQEHVASELQFKTNCSLKLRMDWKRFSIAKCKSLTKIIQLDARINENVQHNWFWAPSTQEPFLYFYVLFYTAYDFRSNRLLSRAIATVDPTIADVPQGCLDNIEITQRTRLVADLFFRPNKSDSDGVLCHSSSTKWTPILSKNDRGVLLDCCKVDNQKNVTKCDKSYIQNKWLGFVDIILLVLFVLSALCGPALVFFLRHPLIIPLLESS